MKPEYEYLVEPSTSSINVKYVERASRPMLSQAWHYHPEVEICYTLKSHGKRFVGNQISDYKAGDLIMFGANLPHGYTTDMRCKQVVIQMKEEFLGRYFLSTPEANGIKSLFRRAKTGIEFSKKTEKAAKPIVKKIMKCSGMNQLIHVLSLLDLLSEADDFTPVCSEEYSVNLDAFQLNRTKVIYEYIITNYTQDVHVSEAAALLNLTEPSFFKFMKRHTRKTFMQIVNEFRISHASKLLIGSNKSIAQISFESGFNNVSYFNRQFKSHMNCTPKEFKQSFS